MERVPFYIPSHSDILTSMSHSIPLSTNNCNICHGINYFFIKIYYIHIKFIFLFLKKDRPSTPARTRQAYRDGLTDPTIRIPDPLGSVPFLNKETVGPFAVIIITIGEKSRAHTGIFGLFTEVILHTVDHTGNQFILFMEQL